MKALVTGAAGFIGSTLVEGLLERGDQVVGVDCFTPYYDIAMKRANAARLAELGVTIDESDLRTDDLDHLLADVDVIFHLAAQPGVRASWEIFDTYVTHNLSATQRVLEAARVTGISHVVIASSSSVYGNAGNYPTAETDPLSPHSPYGVTKRAVEDLARAYSANWGVSAVLLRYFTVYGPRQRDDMAFHRICESVLSGEPFPLFGDGSARRDFTFVTDAVQATIAAGLIDIDEATPVNIAGGDEASMSEVFDLVGDLAGTPVPIERLASQKGDVQRTGGDTSLARDLLGYKPEVTLADGLARQLDWHRNRRSIGDSPS